MGEKADKARRREVRAALLSVLDEPGLATKAATSASAGSSYGTGYGDLDDLLRQQLKSLKLLKKSRRKVRKITAALDSMSSGRPSMLPASLLPPPPAAPAFTDLAGNAWQATLSPAMPPPRANGHDLHKPSTTGRPDLPTWHPDEGR
jgi:hypothetical protein